MSPYIAECFHRYSREPFNMKPYKLPRGCLSFSLYFVFSHGKQHVFSAEVATPSSVTTAAWRSQLRSQPRQTRRRSRTLRSNSRPLECRSSNRDDDIHPPREVERNTEYAKLEKERLAHANMKVLPFPRIEKKTSDSNNDNFSIEIQNGFL